MALLQPISASGDPIEGSADSVDKGGHQRAAIYSREQLDEHVRCTLRFKEMQTKGKILDLERQHLELELYRANQEKIGASGGNSNRLDLFLRYLTTARREFYKALNSYFSVKASLPRLAAE